MLQEVMINVVEKKDIIKPKKNKKLYSFIFGN